MINQNLLTIWDETLSELESLINPNTFNTFFKKMTLEGFYDGICVLIANNNIGIQFLPQANLDTIEELLENRIGETISVKVVAHPGDVASLDLNKIKKVSYPEPSTAIATLMGQYRINPQNTFENFVVGKSNQFAHAACLAIAESMSQNLNDKKNYNPLFIYGGSGLGKTHLMHAIAHHIMAGQPDAKIIYVSSETFTNEMIDALRDNRTARFRGKYRKVDLLLIDDIQFLAKKEGIQEEFFHTFNELHQANKQIIISSDRPPKEIPTLEERLRTRFEWGLITDIQPPDLETRIAILRKKAQMDNQIVGDDVTMFMAEHMETNIRELEGALLSLTAYANMNDLPVSVDVARSFLAKYVTMDKKRQVTGTAIQEKVCDIYNVSPNALAGKSRKREIVFPRQLAMYLCRELTDMSLPKIGDIFGGRDHSTVIHAVEKIEQEMNDDPMFRATVNNIIKEFSHS